MPKMIRRPRKLTKALPMLDRVLVVRTDNAVQQDAPGTGVVPALNEAPVFDPSARTVLVPENLPSTGYVGPSVVATDDGGMDDAGVRPERRRCQQVRTG